MLYLFTFYFQILEYLAAPSLRTSKSVNRLHFAIIQRQFLPCSTVRIGEGRLFTFQLLSIFMFSLLIAQFFFIIAAALLTCVHGSHFENCGCRGHTLLYSSRCIKMSAIELFFVHEAS